MRKRLRFWKMAEKSGFKQTVFYWSGTVHGRALYSARPCSTLFLGTQARAPGVHCLSRNARPCIVWCTPVQFSLFSARMLVHRWCTAVFSVCTPVHYQCTPVQFWQQTYFTSRTSRTISSHLFKPITLQKRKNQNCTYGASFTYLKTLLLHDN